MANQLNGLRSARLKVLRALEHLATIRQNIADYASEEPHKILTELDGRETINVSEEPPVEISILAGEVVYQVRSALDHLAYEIVKLNPNHVALPNHWPKKCEFPLWFDIPDKWPNGPPVPQSFFERVLPGIPATMYAFIEGIQPYRNAPVSKQLRVLAELSNIDKHRHLNVTKARLATNVKVVTPRAEYSLVQRVEDGAKLVPFVGDEGDESVKVERSISVTVSFAEPTIGDWAKYQVPVDDALAVFLDTVIRIIIPEFEKHILD